MTVEKRGTIIFLPENEGSKSECFLPFLYSGRDSLVRIRFKGDNPFENLTLKEHDGKAVVLTGNEDRRGMFLVESVTEI
jgi:hypothetical protein